MPARQIEARVAQLARQSAVAARTHALVAGDRLGRAARAVVEARVGRADAGRALAACARVAAPADAAERGGGGAGGGRVVARRSVDARSTGAGIVLALTPLAAVAAQTHADALPTRAARHEARAAVETVLVVVARAVAAHGHQQRGPAGVMAPVPGAALAAPARVRRPTDTREAGAVVVRLADAAVTAWAAAARRHTTLAVRALEAGRAAAAAGRRARAGGSVEADDGAAPAH